MRRTHLKTLFILIVGIWVLALPNRAFAEQYVQLMHRMLAQGDAQHLFQPAIEKRLFDMVNAYRRSHGANILAEDPAMKDAARAHAADMALHNFLGHVASSGHDFDSRMHALRPGVMVLPTMGENAAGMHRPSSAEFVAQQLFSAWLASAPHLHTLLSRDYLKVATGVTIIDDRAYADQIFTGPQAVTNLGTSNGN
jgi:uncharacterized protein YkwD